MVIGNNRACFVEEFVSEKKRLDDTSVVGDIRVCFVKSLFQKRRGLVIHR